MCVCLLILILACKEKTHAHVHVHDTCRDSLYHRAQLSSQCQSMLLEFLDGVFSILPVRFRRICSVSFMYSLLFVDAISTKSLCLPSDLIVKYALALDCALTNLMSFSGSNSSVGTLAGRFMFNPALAATGFLDSCWMGEATSILAPDIPQEQSCRMVSTQFPRFSISRSSSSCSFSCCSSSSCSSSFAPAPPLAPDYPPPPLAPHSPAPPLPLLKTNQTAGKETVDKRGRERLTQETEQERRTERERHWRTLNKREGGD